MLGSRRLVLGFTMNEASLLGSVYAYVPNLSAAKTPSNKAGLLRQQTNATEPLGGAGAIPDRHCDPLMLTRRFAATQRERHDSCN